MKTVARGGEAETLKIRFKQPGGFAATLQVKTFEIDTAALARDDGRRLPAPVCDSGLPEMEGTGWKFETGADLQTDEITIRSGDASKQFSFDDMSVSKDAYPLLEFLQEKCE